MICRQNTPHAHCSTVARFIRTGKISLGNVRIFSTNYSRHSRTEKLSSRARQKKHSLSAPLSTKGINLSVNRDKTFFDISRSIKFVMKVLDRNDMWLPQSWQIIWIIHLLNKFRNILKLRARFVNFRSTNEWNVNVSK